MDTPLGLNITLKTDYPNALTRVTEALKAEGFGGVISWCWSNPP